MMHGGACIYMHGGACTKNGKTRASIGLQPFLRLKLLLLYIVPQMGTFALHPLWHFVPSPTRGENTLLSSLRAFVPVFLKANLFAMGGRRGVGNFDLSMPFRVWAS